MDRKNRDPWQSDEYKPKKDQSNTKGGKNNDELNTADQNSTTINSDLNINADEWYPPGYFNANHGKSESSGSNKAYLEQHLINDSNNFDEKSYKKSSVSQNKSGTTQNSSKWGPNTHQLPPNFPPKHSVQDRLNKYRKPMVENTKENQEPEKKEMIQNDKLSSLKQNIHILTMTPGKFDDLILGIVENLEPSFGDLNAMTEVTSVIFEQAVREPNFQYIGARLLAVLDYHCPLVKGPLHIFCESELSKSNNLPSLILLYAEIYSQLKLELFGQCLIKALRKITVNNNNIKAVCQTLKLTGGKLEELDKEMIKEILDQLSGIRNSLPSSLAGLVDSVLRLQASNWGREIESETPPAEPAPEWADGPVFYGPDGQQLTNEESEFLAEHLNDMMLDDTDPDALWDPEPEMNDEIREAFAEFLRTTSK